MTVFWAKDLPEVFDALPENVKLDAACSIALLSAFPDMYPVRQRGLMCGHRYFVAGRFNFYYSVATTEIRISAIIPSAMRLA